MFDSFLVRRDSLSNDYKNGEAVGFRFAVQQPDYRGTYLSLTCGFYVNMDGVEYPADAITLEVNGKPPRTLEEIATACWEHWDLQDEAFIHVKKAGGLAPGMHHLGYLPASMDGYGYRKVDAEWIKNPPKPGQGGGKTFRICHFDLELNEKGGNQR